MQEVAAGTEMEAETVGAVGSDRVAWTEGLDSLICWDQECDGGELGKGPLQGK